MKPLGFALGLVAATAAHVLGTRWIAGFPAAVDLFLVLAVMNSLSSSARWSALGGSAAGLARDALSGGLYGLHGFADTLTAWVAARLKQRLVIRKPLQVGLLLVVATAFQLAILVVLGYLLVPGREIPGLPESLVRLTSSGFLGILLFVVSARTRDTLARRRERRRRRLKIAV